MEVLLWLPMQVNALKKQEHFTVRDASRRSGLKKEKRSQSALAEAATTILGHGSQATRVLKLETGLIKIPILTC